MLSNRRVQFNPINTKVVVFKGGLNEQVSNIELAPGELIKCKNYIEQADVYHGYESIKGYEVFDGQALASSVALGELNDDTAREAQRALITAIPGEAGAACSGVHIYQDTVYGFRNAVGSAATGMYKSTATGWSEVDTSGVTIAIDGTSRFKNYRFSLYNSNQEAMFWVDGVSQPHAYNGTTVSEIDMTAVVGAGVYPTRLGTWQNRLFLVYADGHILFSEVGDPTAWDTSTGLAGEIFIGGDITNIIEAPGGVLVVTTEDKIKVIYYGSTTGDFIFKVDSFSDAAGALPFTAQNLFGTVYYTGVQGLSSLQNVTDFGDFSNKIMGKKVQKTFNLNKGSMGWSALDRDNNRLFQFYTDSITSKTSALVYTFVDKRLKGTTTITLNHIMTVLTEGIINNNNVILFGDTQGYVYKFQSGTSFNGEVIDTYLTTSYNNFRSSRNWKHFKRLSFEITADNDTVFNVSASYNYGSAKIPKDLVTSPEVVGSGGLWGSGLWGTFIWGGPIINTAVLYNSGFGTNLAIQVNTSEKYRDTHIIHNVTVDYSVNGIQR